jgi:hypothetical protein
MDSGELVEVSDDVLGIATDLRNLDPNLRLRYSEKQEVWLVYQVEHHPLSNEPLRKQLVTTSVELNPQLVMRVQKVMNPSYDLAGELEKIDAQQKRDIAHARREEIGPKAERLAHAMMKDKALDQRRIFVPGSSKV